MLGETMFNQDTLQNEINNRTIPSENFVSFDPNGGKRARLFVFTPTPIPAQCLRPYKYDFSPNLVDQIITAKEKLNCAVAPNGLGLSSDLVNKSILPTPGGIPLNTSGLQNQWSFVLIVDTTPGFGERRSVMSPTTRIIATGFCSDEPINPTTMYMEHPTLNHSAVLMFTKTNISYVSPSMDSYGVKNVVTNSADMDIVNEVNGMVAGKDLFVATPQDIRSSVFTGGVNSDNQITGAYGELCLSNVKSGESNKLISGMLKTPKIQLGQIMQALDKSIEYTSAVQEGVMNPMSPVMPDSLELARAAFDQNVAGSRQILPRSGIDTSKPISLRDLEYLFPDLEVHPLDVKGSPWDVSPQDIMSARNCMSSMLAASLSNLVPACGFANISFAYRSYTTIGPGMTSGTGAWELWYYRPLVEMSNSMIEKNYNLFKNYFEMELTPILRVVRGEFDLIAHIDVMGQVLLNLNFKDDGPVSNNQLAFYETTNKLGGLTNPLVADLSVLNHNAIQLDTLVADTITKKLGPEQYFKPIIQSGVNDVPFGTYDPVAFQKTQTDISMPHNPPVVGFTERKMPAQAVDYSSLL